MNIKIESMTSTRGNAIPNQFMIKDKINNVVYFQSYNSIIVKIENGKTYLDAEKWDYSVTTGKYRNIFLGEKKIDTVKKINSGEYILTNLNEGKK